MCTSFPEQLQRLHLASGTRTLEELALFLHIRQSTVDGALQRQKLPADWLLTVLRCRHASPEWILTGRGRRYLQKPSVRYETDEDVREKTECDTCLSKIPSAMLAQELVRRITVLENNMFLEDASAEHVLK